MREFSSLDVESTARRVGWAISTERAAQIAATAAPRIAAFARVRSRLSFEDEVAGFASALVETMRGKEAGP